MPKEKDIYKLFKPQLTPKEMLEHGVFGGSYFKDSEMKEFPKSWFKKAKLSKSFDVELNRFKIKSGLPREEWIKKGWIFKEDPLGWFQWYCRYSNGRRIKGMDEVQIQRLTMDKKELREHRIETYTSCLHQEKKIFLQLQ